MLLCQEQWALLSWSNTHLDCIRGAPAGKSLVQPEAGCEAMQTGCLQDTSTAAAGGVVVNWRGGVERGWRGGEVRPTLCPPLCAAHAGRVCKRTRKHYTQLQRTKAIGVVLFDDVS